MAKIKGWTKYSETSWKNDMYGNAWVTLNRESGWWIVRAADEKMRFDNKEMAIAWLYRWMRSHPRG